MHVDTRKILALMAALTLVGLGCSTKTPGSPPQPELPSDAGAVAPPDAAVDKRVIPEGWPVYENPAWGVAQLAYPKGWHLRERPVEETGSADIFIVDFNDEDFFPTETEAFYLEASLSVYRESIENALAVPDGVQLISQTEFKVDGRQFYQLVTQTEFGGDLITTVQYLADHDGLVYELSGFEDSETLEQIARSLRFTGGE